MKDLLTNDAFLYLKSIVEKKRDSVVTSFAKRILAGNNPPTEVEVAYERGFWQGAAAVLNRPENAERVFTDALKRLAEEESHE